MLRHYFIVQMLKSLLTKPVLCQDGQKFPGFMVTWVATGMTLPCAQLEVKKKVYLAPTSSAFLLISMARLALLCTKSELCLPTERSMYFQVQHTEFNTNGFSACFVVVFKTGSCYEHRLAYMLATTQLRLALNS
jgi:hypothetical protein